MSTNYKPETLALHAGYDPADNQQSRAVPIYATTSYVFHDAQEGADLYALKKPGYIYSRLGNPTVNALEDRLAAYHGAAGAIAFSCGSAANAFLFLSVASPGKNIISSPHLYGGTSTLLEHTLKRFGITTKFVNLNDEAALRAAIDDDTVIVFGEGVANPSGYVVDLEKVAKIAHEYGLPLAVDNTSAPPPLLNPFDYGADLLSYSLTKLIGGHGTHLGGMIIEKGDFNWGQNNRFTNYVNAPDPTYGNVNFWQAIGEPNYKEGKSTVFVTRIRIDLMRNIGPVLSPFGAHEFILGLETLPLRARHHSENARKIAEFLDKHPQIAWVHYSGLPQSPYYNLAQKYFSETGPGAVFGFGIKGGYDAALKFIDNVELLSHLANILDARTLVIHPASTTHQQMTTAEREAAGVTDDFIRISVGLEDVNDIMEAIDKALK